MTFTLHTRLLTSIVNARDIVNIHIIMLLAYTWILTFVFGCSPPPVPQDFIEDLTIANVILDSQYMLYHTPGSPCGSPELTRLPADEIELLRQMLTYNFTSAISYEGNKATVSVDISNTGMIEWYNINKLKAGPYAFFDLKRYWVFYLQYSNGRWYLYDDKSINQPPPDGWPAIPDDFLELVSEEEQYLLNDN